MKLFLTESANINLSEKQKEVAKLELSEAQNGNLPFGIIVDIEASHTTRPTLNNTWYTEKGLRSGVSSWTSPYPKPVLQDHIKDLNGFFGAMGAGVDAKGRIIGAKLKNIEGVKSEDGTDAKVLTLAAFVPGEEDVAKVLDGRYHTVSIGIVSNKVNCSICGTNIAEDYCGHMKGRTYEIERNGKTVKEKCFWLINQTEAVEVSFVNEPADQSAQVVAIRTTLAQGETLPGIVSQSESQSELFVLTGSDIIPAVEEETDASTAVAISLKEAWEQAQSKLTKEKPDLDGKPEFLTVEELVDLSLPGVESEEETLVESNSEQSTAEESSETSEGESTETTSEDDLLTAVEDSTKTEESTEDSTKTVGQTEEVHEESTESTDSVELNELQEKIKDMEQKLQESDSALQSSISEKEVLKEQNTRLRTALSKMLAEHLTDLELFAGDVKASEYSERHASNLSTVAEHPSDLLNQIRSLRESELERTNQFQENETLSTEESEEEPNRPNAESILMSALRERKAGIKNRKRTNQ
jgi:hypothetical protein